MAWDHSLRSGGETQAACLTNRTATFRAFTCPEVMQTLHSVRGVHRLQYLEQLRPGRRPYPLPLVGKCGAGDAQAAQRLAIGTQAVHGRKDASESDTESLT